MELFKVFKKIKLNTDIQKFDGIQNLETRQTYQNQTML